MTRDYSQFLPTPDLSEHTIQSRSTTRLLGWQTFFSQQVSMDQIAESPPVRVVEVHRNGLHVLGDNIDMIIPPDPDTTVGDWLLLDRSRPGASQRLQRKSLFKRRASGTAREIQLIAANVDTAFVMSSCNQDFNVARLERYLVLAFEADVTPVIVLTKSDICKRPDYYEANASEIAKDVPVITLDARSPQETAKLSPWCKAGQTIAFLGSSGVGKSTLVNTISGTSVVATRAVREDDDKGRHTTTRRQIHMLASGCAVLDTPGMRELQVTDAGSGVAGVFADLHTLAAQCRFNDCRHETEPGCAVMAAVENGAVDGARLARWRKLAAEERFNSASLAERKSKDKALGKAIRQIKKLKSK